ncbi:MAG: lyase family protein [Streptosporangiaceae bacterium]|jgi:3-carboxy-cis,cis-muconate cycloisomerase
MELLLRLYGDPVTEEILGEEATIGEWLHVEATLAGALADSGVITADDASAIAAACTIKNIDTTRLWEQTRIVGYPILPLIKMICEHLPPRPAGFVHWGATTQDIMDTALGLQVSKTLTRLEELVTTFGDELAARTKTHAMTVMPGRTHGQQAVPTTFGAKCAVFLDQAGRDRRRLRRAKTEIAVVSLFGGGGTSAAMGKVATQVRSALARRLALRDSIVPWHVARDTVTETGQVAALAAGTAVRFAREIADLARTEIGEVAEADGEYRGASSTMPQKANPILAEAIIGLGVSAGQMSGALLRSLEAGHERATGEWQVEWQALPYVLRCAAGAVGLAGQLTKGLRVDADRMRRNLALDHGLIMAEAHMARLATAIGRDRAHAAVYQKARRARVTGEPLDGIAPEDYTGSAAAICTASLERWKETA